MTEESSTALTVPGPAFDPEAMQQLRDAFDQLCEAIREVAAKIYEAMKPIIDAVINVGRRIWRSIAACVVPRKWIHLAEHAKKARTRKKYRNRIRRAVLEALSEATK